MEPGNHFFRLNQIDFDGHSWLSPEIEIAVELADRYLVEEAYPNPFNPSTTVRFAVGSEQNVVAALFDPLGRQIRMLLSDRVAANQMHTLSIEAGNLPTGLYLVHIRGEHFSTSRLIALIR